MADTITILSILTIIVTIIIAIVAIILSLTRNGSTGSAGTQGSIGPTGPVSSDAGITGSIGPIGPIGPTGIGQEGQTGPQGVTGQIGPTGLMGSYGPNLDSICIILQIPTGTEIEIDTGSVIPMGTNTVLSKSGNSMIILPATNAIELVNIGSYLVHWYIQGVIKNDNDQTLQVGLRQGAISFRGYSQGANFNQGNPTELYGDTIIQTTIPSDYFELINTGTGPITATEVSTPNGLSYFATITIIKIG